MSPEGTGKIAVITGAASGIGQAASRRLLDDGWTVFGFDVAEDRLDAVRDGFATFQTRFRPVVCDVGDADIGEGALGDQLGRGVHDTPARARALGAQALPQLVGRRR